MRPLKTVDLNEIEEDDMVAFQRTNKGGETVSLLGFVNRINLSEDKTEIISFELLPMVPSDKAPELQDAETFEISHEKDVQHSGLDTPHTVYGMSFRVTPDDFPQGTIQRLGYLHEIIAGRVCTFADNTQDEKPNYFGLHPDVVAGIGFPAMDINTRRQHQRPDLSGFAMEPKKAMGYDYTPVESGGEQPDIEGNPWADFQYK